MPLLLIIAAAACSYREHHAKQAHGKHLLSSQCSNRCSLQPADQPLAAAACLGSPCVLLGLCLCKGNYRLYVGHLDSVADLCLVPCCSAGAVLDLAKILPTRFKSGQLVCPNSSAVCPTLGCRDACRNGYCWQGKCYCHLEFTGAGCSQSLVPSLVSSRAWQSLPAPRG